MTDAELLTFANEYFAAHLDAGYWGGLEEPTRTAALTMAVRDLGANTTSLGEARAVCEQAVYLVRNYDAQTKGRVVTNQGIEGMSQTFALIGDAEDAGIAPRARRLMQMARGRTLGVVRG